MTALDTLGWALVHSLWQGALLVAAFRLLVWVGRAPAAARYAAAYAALLALPVATLVTGAVLGTGAASSVTGRVDGMAPTAAGGAARFTAASIYGPIAPAARWMALAWLAVVAVLLLRWAGGWWLVTRLRTTATRPARAMWESALAAAAARTGVRIPVTLLESTAVDTPMVVGQRRPCVLLPVPAFEALGRAEAESVLAHELAHVGRHDVAANAVQTLIDVLLFFNPAARWLSALAREERELCCDAAAVRATGNRVVYARALARLETIRSALDGRRLAVAASGGSLLRRLQQLTDGVDDEPRATAFPRIAVASAVVVTLVALGAVGRVVIPPTARTAVAHAARASTAPVAERYTVHAHDPAGQFSITFERGRPAHATVGGVAVTRERLVVRGDSLYLPWGGAGHFAVRLKRDGFTWAPRPAPTPRT